jgi:hypothetical protein
MEHEKEENGETVRMQTNFRVWAEKLTEIKGIMIKIIIGLVRETHFRLSVFSL